VLERILRISIRHRFLVIVVTLAVGAAGFFALRNLPIDAVPDITSNQVVVNTEATSLAPLEVEKQVTTPIENALSGITGLQLTRSHSWNGLSQITAYFDDDVDVYFARQQVSERLLEARETLPAGAEPRLGGITTGLGDVYMWAVEFEHPDGKGAEVHDGKPGWQSDGSYLTPEGGRLADDIARATYLRTVMDWIVRPQVKGVKDVADIDVQGGYLKQYQVSPDPAKLASYGLSLKDLADALERNNTSAGAKYVEHKGDAYIVRVAGRLTNINQIADVTIAQRNGTPIHVRDVATVGLGTDVRTGAGSLNGREVVLAIAQMLTGANSRTVSAAIHEKLFDPQTGQSRIKLPPDIRNRTILNRTKLVDSTIHTVAKNLAEGAILVVIILLLILGNIRAAIIAALAIPLSMLIAASGMLQFRISGNLMSLGAIDFGLIVDGAVIIVENSLRRLGLRQHELGRKLSKSERLDEVLESSKQVLSPAAFGSAIIIIVYLPILALIGVAGKMFRPMALTVILALVAAFILSLTFVPAMVGTIMAGRVRERENFLVRIAQWGYRPILYGVLKLRWAVVPLAIAGFAASLLLLRAPDDDHKDRLGRDFIPKLDEGDFLVIANRDPASGLSLSTDIQMQIEKALLDIPEIQFVASKTGTGDMASDPIPLNSADTFVILKPREQWPNPRRSKKALQKEIEDTLEDVPGSTYEFVQPIEDRFNELISGVRTDVAASVIGEDFDKTLPAAQGVYRIVKRMDGKDVSEPKAMDALPTLQIEVDPAACSRLGLSAADVQDVVSTAVGGREAGIIFEGDRRFPVVVRLPGALRRDIGALARLPVPLPKPDAEPPPARFSSAGGAVSPSSRAGFVPLSAVAKIEVTKGPNEIVHANGKRNVVITFNVRGRDIGSFVADARRRVDEQVASKLPAGMSVEWGGQFEVMNQTWQRLAVIVPIGLGLILILLYTTFGSVRDAMIVFSGVPLALTGGIIALWLRRGHFEKGEWVPDMNLSISAGVGFIALSGVAVLNGLVMVSFINQLRRQGLPLEEAIIRGSLTRLRPVLMTALVAALGFLPMALATGAGAEVQKPLATVVIGGIISSTVLTLFVLPALYRLLHLKPREESKASSSPPPPPTPPMATVYEPAPAAV
jgi:cobalt-zinc-cadmium resistance protein CzcA